MATVGRPTQGQTGVSGLEHTRAHAPAAVDKASFSDAVVAHGSAQPSNPATYVPSPKKNGSVGVSPHLEPWSSYKPRYAPTRTAAGGALNPLSVDWISKSADAHRRVDRKDLARLKRQARPAPAG